MILRKLMHLAISHTIPQFCLGLLQGNFFRETISMSTDSTLNGTDCYMNYRKCNARDDNEHVPEKWRPKEFTDHVATFLEKWAFGSFPRRIPVNISPYFPDNHGIRKPLYYTRTQFESKFDF